MKTLHLSIGCIKRKNYLTGSLFTGYFKNFIKGFSATFLVPSQSLDLQIPKRSLLLGFVACKWAKTKFSEGLAPPKHGACKKKSAV